jgi:hypothetical protein
VLGGEKQLLAAWVVCSSEQDPLITLGRADRRPCTCEPQSLPTPPRPSVSIEKRREDLCASSSSMSCNKRAAMLLFSSGPRNFSPRLKYKHTHTWCAAGERRGAQAFGPTEEHALCLCWLILRLDKCAARLKRASSVLASFFNYAKGCAGIYKFSLLVNGWRL